MQQLAKITLREPCQDFGLSSHPDD
jgi:hypothetical protein